MLVTDLDRPLGRDPLGEEGGSLNRRMTRGAAWMIGLRFAGGIIGFLSTIVLARLLMPSDFGLIALAMAMVAAIGIFGEFGFDSALIQNQKAERRHYDTAWTLSIIRGLLAALIIMLLAEPLANLPPMPPPSASFFHTQAACMAAPSAAPSPFTGTVSVWKTSAMAWHQEGDRERPR